MGTELGLSGRTGSRGEFLVLHSHVAPSGGETKMTLDLVVFCFVVNFSSYKKSKKPTERSTGSHSSSIERYSLRSDGLTKKSH